MDSIRAVQSQWRPRQQAGPVVKGLCPGTGDFSAAAWHTAALGWKAGRFQAIDLEWMTYLATLTSEGRMVKREERGARKAVRGGVEWEIVCWSRALYSLALLWGPMSTLLSSGPWPYGSLLSLTLGGPGTHTSSILQTSSAWPAH